MRHTAQTTKWSQDVEQEALPVDKKKRDKILLWLQVSSLREQRPKNHEQDLVVVSSQSPASPDGHFHRARHLK